MPIYEFDCEGCGHRFEALVISTDPTPPSCPACSGEILARVLSAFAVNSDSTRHSALASGREHQAKEQRDKRIADHEASHHHDH